jgi:uncharacterized protein YjbI with pentapeptide repeats
MEAFRTGLTVVAGSGGAVALLLAARRQWINERAQHHRELEAEREHQHRERVQRHSESVASATADHQEKLAREAERDAAERRVTELYTKAVALLGDEKAPVRLGGLYALERLGEDNETQRPVIVSVVCAYLRMPAVPDVHEAPVRQAAQRLLLRHLRPDSGVTYWPHIRLDLADAELRDFDASGCTLVEPDFTGAQFRGRTSFAGTTFAGPSRMSASFETVSFDAAVCTGDVVLDDAHVDGDASFDRAEFRGTVSLRRATFRLASFVDATFRRSGSLDGTAFRDNATFRGAVFERNLSAEHVEFAQEADFRSARFDDIVLLRWTVFRQGAVFERATFAGSVNLARTEFHGEANFAGATLSRTPQVDQMKAKESNAHVWPPGIRATRSGDWLVFSDAPARRSG